MSARPRLAPLELAVIGLGLAIGIAMLAQVWNVDASSISRSAGKPPTWDFTNLWMGGRLASAGEVDTLFDLARYREALRATFGPTIRDSEWSYPPSILLIGVPLAMLPLYAAYALWTAGTLGLFARVLRGGGLPWPACAVVAFSPALFTNAAYGQNGALTAALLIGGLAFARSRPLLAGLMLATLTMKPHLGILVPVCLLAAGNWRTISWAALFGAAIALGTGLAFGFEVWWRFFTETQPLMRGILDAPYGQSYHEIGVTVFLLARSLGADLAWSYGAQGLAAAAAAVMAWRLWRQDNSDILLKAVTTALLTLLATPYAYTYDMAALPAAVAILVSRGQGPTVLLATCWIWPAISPTVMRAVGPISPLVVAWLAVVCCLALAHAGRDAAVPERG